MSGLGEPYTCGNCGGEFTKIITDEEATAEAESLFPAGDLEDVDIVCDDCFRMVMAWAEVAMPGLTSAAAPQPIVIAWADGRISWYDLTQPAPLIYPAPRAARILYPAPRATASGHEKPSFGTCYQMGNGSMVHVKPDCRCRR